MSDPLNEHTKGEEIMNALFTLQLWFTECLHALADYVGRLTILGPSYVPVAVPVPLPPLSRDGGMLWDRGDELLLLTMASEGHSIAEMALRLGRTKGAVRSRLRQLRRNI